MRIAIITQQLTNGRNITTKLIKKNSRRKYQQLYNSRRRYHTTTYQWQGISLHKNWPMAGEIITQLTNDKRHYHKTIDQWQVTSLHNDWPMTRYITTHKWQMAGENTTKQFANDRSQQHITIVQWKKTSPRVQIDQWQEKIP